MKLFDLLAGVEVVSLSPGIGDIEVTAVCSDSRKLSKNDLFVAISGKHFDGHSFCADALALGAAAVVTERDLGLASQVVVRDTRGALALITANYHKNPAARLRLVGVTGTSGKTSTTYMIKSMLERTGKKCGLIGTVECMAGDRSFGAEQTTPEPAELLRLLKIMEAEGCEFVVMEVSSQGLAQGRVDGLFFEVAAFTNLSQDHLDYHGTMEKYLDAKKPLFARCGAAVSNADDAKGYEALERFKGSPLMVSALGKGGLNAENVVNDVDGTAFDLVYRGERRRVRLPILGNFTVYNALIAAGVVLSLGVDFDEVCRSFFSVKVIPGRLEKIPTGRDFSVLLDYAHKPDAIEKVLQTVRGFAEGRVVIVFGCGGDRDREKRPIMGRIAEQLADFVYVTSDNPRHEDPAEIIAEIVAGMSLPGKRRVLVDRREAIRTAIYEHQPGDTIILAGKGHETYQKIGDSTLRFDEREILANLLAGLA